MKGDLWSLGPTPNGTACHWRSRATKKLCRGLFKIWPHISTHDPGILLVTLLNHLLNNIEYLFNLFHRDGGMRHHET